MPPNAPRKLTSRARRPPATGLRNDWRIRTTRTWIGNAHKLHWNGRVHGRRLKRGTYLIIVQAGSHGHVTDASAPLTLKLK